MLAGATKETPSRPKRIGRLVTVAICSLMALGLALLIGVLNRGPDSARFAGLREGMTMPEVLEVLQPLTTVDRDPVPDEGPLPPHRVVLFQFSEDPIYPVFGAALTFVNGRLTDKEFRRPSLQGLLQYWWARLKP